MKKVSPIARLAPRASVVIWAITIAMISLLLVGGIFFSFPAADDLSRAYKAQHDGLFGSMRQEYLGWSGRWFGTGLSYLAGLWVNQIDTYWIALGAVLSVFTFAVARLVATLVPSKGLAFPATATACFIALYWSRCPEPGETFYWRTGAFENLLSLALAMLAACCAVSLPESRSKWRACALTCLLVLLACGAHELYGAMLAITLACWAACAAVSRRVGWGFIGLILLSVLVGMLVVLLAPGNKGRIAWSPNYGDVRYTLLAGTFAGYQAVRSWITDLGIWLATLLFLLHPEVRAVQKERLGTLPRWTKASILLAWCAVLGVGLYGPFYAGAWLAPRTLNAVYLWFLVGWFVNALVHVHISDDLLRALPLDSHLARSALVTLFSASLLLGPTFRTPPFRKQLRDLLVLAPAYHRERCERDALIREEASRGIRDVVVPRSRYAPYMSLGVGGELSQFTDFWLNRQYALYYGVQTIRLAERDRSRKEDGEWLENPYDASRRLEPQQTMKNPSQ